MIIRSKAPLRIGLAGGGTDVSPYSDLYGGAILNATINMYAHCTIIPVPGRNIEFISEDTGMTRLSPLDDVLEHGNLKLHVGVYNRLVKEFDLDYRKLSCKVITRVDTPPGSGLGSSSTLVVAILGAFREWLDLPLGEYDIAHLAWSIEREDLEMIGGKQDQYTATFGGFNFMEFQANDRVIVNPLRMKPMVINELAHNLVLCYSGVSRISSIIIEDQSKNVTNKNIGALDAMDQLKSQAFMLKDILLRGNIDEVGRLLDFGWDNKKKMSTLMTTNTVDRIYDTAKLYGSTGGKVSGAGGGGFMFFYCPGSTRGGVIDGLSKLGIETFRYEFESQGMISWKI